MSTVLPTVATLGLLTACMALSTAAQAEAVVGLTSTNALVRFDSASPLNASTPVNITGLFTTNEQILGIDRRPANNLLYGLGSSGRLYILNEFTGTASFVSQISGATLEGSNFGIDFNPTVDRLRVVSDRLITQTSPVTYGQNLRINVDTGAATVDGNLNGAGTYLTGVAYTNNFAGTGSTALYGIYLDSLYLQSPPNDGTLTFVGPLGGETSRTPPLNSIRNAGFDISGQTGIAYAALTTGAGKSSFYQVSLGNGHATRIGAFGYEGNTAIAAPLVDIAVSAVPEPGTWALFALGLGVVGARAGRGRQAT